MGARTQPVEIVVRAKPTDTLAEVSWEFTRHQIIHRFSMQMFTSLVTSGLEHPIKDHELRIQIPTVKGSSGPRHIETTHKIGETDYRAMVDSVLGIVKKHDMILQAQTDTFSVCRVRDPDFKFPLWHDQRTGYSAIKLREALLASTSVVRPKRAQNPMSWPLNNGHLPDTGNSEPTDPAVAAIEIIEKHRPAERDPYIDGISDLQALIEQMRGAIASQLAQFEKDPRNETSIRIYQGYDKMLHTILNRGDALMAQRRKLPTFDDAGMSDIMARINKVLEE